MSALKVVLGYREVPPNETPVLESCKVNRVELVGDSCPPETLVALGTGLLHG